VFQLLIGYLLFFFTETENCQNFHFFFVSKKEEKVYLQLISSNSDLIFLFHDVFSQLYGFVFSVDIFLFWPFTKFLILITVFQKNNHLHSLFSSSSRLNALATPSARQFRIAHTKTHLSFFLLLYCISDLYTQNCIFIFSHPSSVCFQKINNHINNLSTHP